MEELYLNDILIELKSNTVSQTLQINDIGDVKDRQSNYSNNIKISKTPSNIRAFEFLGVAGNGTRFPYKNVVVKYIVNGIELISEGKGIIKNTNDYFNLVVYDGNISMTELLGDKQLNGLDFSAYNHNLNYDLWLNSFTNTDGYIYALGKFYEVNESFTTISLQTPSFYSHTLFEMIFLQKGYTVSGAIFSDVNFKDRLIAMNNGYERTIIDDTDPFPEYSRNNSLDPTVNETYTIVTTDQFLIDSYLVSNSLTHEITLVGSVSVKSGTNKFLVLKVDGIEKERIAFFSGNFNESVLLFAENLSTIQIFIEMQSVEDIGTQTINFDTFYTTEIFENNVYVEVDFNKLIGEVKQIDYVKDIMQRYGLIFRKTKNENNFEFIQLSKLLEDYDNAEDWSDKYSDFANEEYKPKYSQTNKAKYKYDDNDSETEQTFGNGEFYIDNVNLDIEKTVFTSVFKASSVSNNPPCYQLFQWELKDDKIVPLDDGIRYFKKTEINTFIDVKFSEDIVNTSQYSGVVPYLDFNTVNYQTEIDLHYQEFISMLQDYNVTTINANLNNIDIYNIDFFKLKYFNQLGAYYYLNKVNSFKQNKKTKVNLVKVGDKIVSPLFITGASNGVSTVTADIDSLSAGTIAGASFGSSTVLAVIDSDAVSPFLTSTTGANVAIACGSALDIIRYHNGINETPIIDDIIYTDISGTIPFNGGNLWYNTDNLEIINIDTNGIVVGINSCI